MLERPQHVSAVVLILGPYRNLTTLSASILALHPQCQILNHAGGRQRLRRKDFISRFSEKRLDRFAKLAFEYSAGGSRGGKGGSIVFSHAFDRDDMRDEYVARYGDTLIKQDANVLVWKESQLVTNKIRSSPGRIEQLVSGTERLRFVMPVRNPIDCALSNVKTGHAKRIPGVDPDDVPSVLEAIVESIGWFARLAEKYPSRFLLFFEGDSPDEVCDGMVRVFGLSNDAQWRASVERVLNVRGGHYEHSSELLEAFYTSARRHLSDVPLVAQRALALVDDH